MSAPPDRSRPPEPAGAATPFALPPFVRGELANGLGLYVARLPRAPLVSMIAMLPAGGHFDPIGRPGVASFHGYLLDNGGKRRSAVEIATQVESLGGLMGSSAGWGMAFVEVGMLARHLDAALDLMSEAVREPGFPDAEVERLRRRRSAEVLRRRDQPRKLTAQLHDAVLYQGTVYGQLLPGTAESVAALTRGEILDFHQRHSVPQGSAILVVGDVDEEDVVRRLETTFGDWTGGPAVPAPTIEPPPRRGVDVYLVDRPKAPQTELAVGHVGIARTDPDFGAIRLLSTLLGGMFNSRLNLNLRERHGFTYSVQSSFAMRHGPGPFRVRAAVTNESAGKAVEEILHEIRRLRDEPIPIDELRHAQGYLVDIFPYTLQTIDDLSKRLETLATFGLPDDYYDSYPANLWDYGPEELLEVARRRLHPDDAVVVATGDAESLRPQLEHLGRVHVVTPEEVLRGERGTIAS